MSKYILLKTQAWKTNGPKGQAQGKIVKLIRIHTY